MKRIPQLISRLATPSFDALQGFALVPGIGPSSRCEDVGILFSYAFLFLSLIWHSIHHHLALLLSCPGAVFSALVYHLSAGLMTIATFIELTFKLLGLPHLPLSLARLVGFATSFLEASSSCWLRHTFL